MAKSGPPQGQLGQPGLPQSQLVTILRPPMAKLGPTGATLGQSGLPWDQQQSYSDHLQPNWDHLGPHWGNQGYPGTNSNHTGTTHGQTGTNWGNQGWSHHSVTTQGRTGATVGCIGANWEHRGVHLSQLYPARGNPTAERAPGTGGRHHPRLPHGVAPPLSPAPTTGTALAANHRPRSTEAKLPGGCGAARVSPALCCAPYGSVLWGTAPYGTAARPTAPHPTAPHPRAAQRPRPAGP